MKKRGPERILYMLYLVRDSIVDRRNWGSRFFP